MLNQVENPFETDDDTIDVENADLEAVWAAAEETIDSLAKQLEGSHMVFIAAGMGGGTGTGAAPIIARIAKEQKVLTVGVVTKPFHFEGRHRMRLADAGISELQRYVDTLIVIPNQNLFLVANPNTTWNQVNGALPNQRIQVYGPPPTSGTRDAFLELGMTPGAKLVPAAAAVEAADADRFEALAHTLREDGVWIDSGENDNAIVQTLTRTPGSLGVFGFSFLEQNLDTVKAETIDGVAPTADTIADGSYPLARSLYIYVKKQHIGVIPGLQQFVQEFMSDGSAGRGGWNACACWSCCGASFGAGPPPAATAHTPRRASVWPKYPRATQARGSADAPASPRQGADGARGGCGARPPLHPHAPDPAAGHPDAARLARTGRYHPAAALPGSPGARDAEVAAQAHLPRTHRTQPRRSPGAAERQTHRRRDR